MREEIAEKYFLQGCNCCQSVALAFSDKLGFSEETIKKLTIGFGGGLARQRLTCGAVSAMAMVLSALLSDGENKAQIYGIIQKACEDFKAETGSVVCAELLSGNPILKDKSAVPETRTPEFYKKRPCLELCKLAVSITEKYLNS